MSRITREPIDEAAVIEEVASPAAGAVVTFSGVVRNENAGRQVEAIDYHAYEEMALKELDRVEADAAQRWPEIRIRIVHRIGWLEIGESSVFMAVSSPHRADGFEATRFAIDRIKENVPIWKKEIYPDGHAWIEGS